jgi:hypothetical protein
MAQIVRPTAFDTVTRRRSRGVMVSRVGSNPPGSHRFAPVWPVCSLARRGSVWHGPLSVEGVRRP